MVGMVPRLARLLVIAFAVTAVAVVHPPAADAGSWGPAQISYLNGVICADETTDTALVSWPGSAGSPAFALAPVTGPSAGQLMQTSTPAISGTSGAPDGNSGLDPSEIPALAYLITTYGSDPGAGVVGDVAARVIEQTVGDPRVTSCLAENQGGTSPQVDARLWAEAVKRAGPYTVTVTAPNKPAESNAPVPITARVRAATGAAVSGMSVTFAAADPTTVLSSTSAVTDARGDAQVTATVSAAATQATTAISASVTASTGLVETTAPSAVSLIAAAAPQTYSGQLDLAVDTTPQPVLSITNAQPLLLAGSPVQSTLGVTGLHGHAATVTVTTYGPLAVDPQTGCTAHTPAEWKQERSANRTAGSAHIPITGDGNYTVPNLPTAPAAGCYQVGASIVTTDATPNVTRSVPGQVVTIAAVTPSATPTGHGLASPGALSTTLAATGGNFTASWSNVDGNLLGPRQPVDGTCPTTGWQDTDTAAGVDQPTQSSASVTLASGAVTATGCYAFDFTATLTLGNLGSVPVTFAPGTADAPVLVIAPTVVANSLASSGVATGSPVSASVTLSGTLGQKGTLQLSLARLPYTFRGCFGADWSHARIVAATTHAAGTPTTGDTTYTVRSGALPGEGCWTVVPVFTAALNTAVQASGTAGLDPMLAFTGTPRPPSAQVHDTAAPQNTDNALRISLTGAITGLLLAFIVLRTVFWARRFRSPLAEI